MAKKLSTQAQLKLSVDDALSKIKQLSAQLKEVKEKVGEPVKIDVQVDTSKFTAQMNDIKKVLGGTRNAKGQFSTIASDIRGIRTELTNLSKTLTAVVGNLSDASTEANKFSNSLNRSLSGNSQQITGLVNNVEQFNVTLRKSSEESKNFKNNIMGAFSAASTALSSLMSGLDKAYGSFRNIGTTFLSTIGNIATQSLDMVGFSVTGMVDEAMEQERKLQQSKIGFGNMFKGQDTDAMVSQIRQTAAASPGLNSGDLADYINQLGAVAGGDFNTAFNATMGILKTVSYGGGDANSQMGYIIKNVRDVMAKGKATAVDVQQFNRAMPLLTDALEAIGASEFLKDGELTITKDNAYKLMEAFANLNTSANPAYNIFDQTSKTLAGIQEEFREATASAIAEGLESIGFFDALANVAKNSFLPEIEADIKTFFDWIGEIAQGIDWKQLQSQVGDVVTEIKTLIGELAYYLKDNFLNTDTLKLVIQLVGEFLKGLLEGAKGLLQFINGIRQWLGDDGLKNLAYQLGNAVTQGLIMSKVLSMLAGGLETFSHVAQASFFLSQNVGKGVSAGGGGGTQANALGSLMSLSGLPGWPTISGNTFSQKVGSMVTTISGGRVLLGDRVAKGISGVGSLAKSGLSLVGQLGTSALKGGAVALLTDAVSGTVRNLNMFGEATNSVADVLKVGGAAIAGAIAGKVLGPLGMLGGALLGAVVAIKQAEQAANERKAAETTEAVKKLKSDKGEEVVEETIKAYQAAGGVFDAGTNAGTWARNELVKWLDSHNMEEWTAEKALDVLSEAIRQKSLHEKMVGVGSTDEFKYLEGAKVDWITEQNGVRLVTDKGKELADIIRKYNLIGAKDDEIESINDETLISTYLNGNELNLAQLDYLKQKSIEFENEVATVTTDSRDKITEAIEKAGNINDAITQATEAGDQMVADALSFIKAIDLKILEARGVIVDSIGNNPVVDEETLKELVGDSAAARAKEWEGRGWWQKNLFDVGSGARNSLVGVLGGNGESQSIIRVQESIDSLGREILGGNLSAEDKAKKESLLNTLLAAKDRYNQIEAGDWDSLKDMYNEMAGALISQEYFDWLPEKSRPTESQLADDNEFYNYVGWLIAELRKGGFDRVPRSLYVRGRTVEAAFASGGIVTPIYRAGGGVGRGVDIVPAYLQPGEFVQRQSAVQKAGLSVMNALNNGDLGQAYRLIGAKLSNTWDHSRTVNNRSDNRRFQSNNFFIRNTTNAGRAGTRSSIANHIALGY